MRSLISVFLPAFFAYFRLLMEFVQYLIGFICCILHASLIGADKRGSLKKRAMHIKAQTKERSFMF